MDSGLHEVRNRRYVIDNPTVRSTTTALPLIVFSVALIVATAFGYLLGQETNTTPVVADSDNVEALLLAQGTRDAALVDGIVQGLNPHTPTPTATPVRTPAPTPTIEPWTQYTVCEQAQPGETCVLIPQDARPSSTPTPLPTIGPCPERFVVDSRVAGMSPELVDPLVCQKPYPTPDITVVQAAPTSTPIAVPTNQAPPPL